MLDYLLLFIVQLQWPTLRMSQQSNINLDRKTPSGIQHVKHCVDAEGVFVFIFIFYVQNLSIELHHGLLFEIHANLQQVLLVEPQYHPSE